MTRNRGRDPGTTHTLEGLMARMVRSLAAIAATLVSGFAFTGAAQAQQASPAPAVETPASLAKQAFEFTKKALDVEARLPKLQAELASIDAQVGKLAGGMADDKRRASELLVAAKRQAIQTYLRGDSQSQTYAVANAIGQKNSNDAAWSLGVLQVTNRKTVDLMQAARTRGAGASKELTAALSSRDRAKDAITRVETDAKSYRRAAETVSTKIEALVIAQAPVVIGTLTTVAYEAYRRSAATLSSERPSCGIRWELLAAIGKTESDHGAGRLDSTGVTKPPIVGIPTGPDTDGGKYDGDTAKDHAVGPMQFIPSTWILYLSDGNGDGISDINNIFDESLASARYLCVAAGSLTLTTKAGVTRAILAYNPNQEYLRTVGARFEALAQDVARGWFSAADLPQAPPPVPGIGPGGATGGSPTPSTPPAITPTASTEVRPVTLFGASSVVVPTVAPTPLEGTCASPTRRMAPRVGAFACIPTGGGAALDPCVVAPYDRTQLACIDDPDKPVTLVHVAAPMAPTPFEPAPPYFGLVLPGNDRCLPVATSNVTASNQTAPPATTSTTTVLAGTTTTVVAGTTTTVAGTATTATPTTTVAATTTTTPAAPTPNPDATTYHCSSGADIVGQPVVTASFWTVTVRQSGIANRSVPVAIVYS
jgi:membrane-bound lytic murein transglycosylase B